MKMLQNCNNQVATKKPDLPEPKIDLPNAIEVDGLPDGLANIPRQAQMIVMLLSCQWTHSQIAEAHGTTRQAISKYIDEHGLMKWVGMVAPQARQKFEAARWSQLQHACLTRAQAGISEMSPSQAVVAAAIAVDKRSAIDPPAQREGDAPGELEAQLTIRFKRK